MSSTGSSPVSAPANPNQEKMMTNIHRLPIAIFIAMSSTMILSYFFSVIGGHVYPTIPYIFETGSFPPESCLFSLMVTAVSVLLVIHFWIRYQQVETRLKKDQQGIHDLLFSVNNASLLLGLTSAAALFVAANVQEPHVPPLHFLAVTVFFVSTLLMMYTDVYISSNVNLCPVYITKRRIGLLIGQTLLVQLGIISGIASYFMFEGSDMTKWRPNDGGHMLHVVSSASEWLAMVNFLGYILTYTREFRHIHVTMPKVCFVTP